MNQKGTPKEIFNAIYMDQSDSVFRFCLFRVSSREQALDLTQEVFVRLWQSQIEEKEISNPRAFLFTVARHVIIDWYRKKKPISLEGLSENDDQDSFEVSDESTVVSRELEVEGRFVIDKIDELGPSYRDAVYLRFVEGLSPDEIGKILGMSVNATSVRINRGIQELRKLTGYEIDEK